MSIQLLIAELNNWNNIGDGQRWMKSSDGFIKTQNLQQHPKSGFERLTTGSNSLALVIQGMTQELLRNAQNSAGQKEAEEKDLPIAAMVTDLQLKVTAKIKKYNQQHNCLYKFVMRLLGRDVEKAAKEFTEACLTIKLIYNKCIPVDRTSELESLTKDHRFSKLKEDERFVKFSLYIQILPLARHLNATFDEVANLVLSNPFTRMDAPLVAGQLIEQKKKLKASENLEEILKILDEAGMCSYYYHGTNIYALEVMKTHGLGTDKRDYDPALLQRVELLASGNSGLKTEQFHVSGCADFSYGYANRSPEWAYLSNGRYPEHVSKEDRAAHDALREKYSKTTEIALVQIQLVHKENAGRLKANVDFVRSGQGSPTFVIKNFAQDHNINKVIRNADFHPVSVVYYRLPRLSVQA